MEDAADDHAAGKTRQSLELLEKLQAAGGKAAIRARDLTRTHRERLMAAGFLQGVIKGWYIPSRPDELKRESTAWYASFWRFCAAYLEERFGADWCLSPEQSLSLHAGNWTVPRQLMVRSARARNKITKLPHGTSLFDLRAALHQRAKVGIAINAVEADRSDGLVGRGVENQLKRSELEDGHPHVAEARRDFASGLELLNGAKEVLHATTATVAGHQVPSPATQRSRSI